VLTDKLVIKRIRPEAMDSADADAGMPENVAERFEADFALMTGEFSGLLNDLVEALGGAQA